MFYGQLKNFRDILHAHHIKQRFLAPPPPPQESSESETDDVETVIDAEEKQDVDSVQDIPNEKPDENEEKRDKTSPISSKSKFNLLSFLQM